MHELKLYTLIESCAAKHWFFSFPPYVLLYKRTFYLAISIAQKFRRLLFAMLTDSSDIRGKYSY